MKGIVRFYDNSIELEKRHIMDLVLLTDLVRKGKESFGFKYRDLKPRRVKSNLDGFLDDDLRFHLYGYSVNYLDTQDGDIDEEPLEYVYSFIGRNEKRFCDIVLIMRVNLENGDIEYTNYIVWDGEKDIVLNGLFNKNIGYDILDSIDKVINKDLRNYRERKMIQQGLVQLEAEKSIGRKLPIKFIF